MSKVEELLNQVAFARKSFVQTASGLSYAQSQFKPAADEWSVVDNVEHLYWAEMGGINGIWRTWESMKNGLSVWSGENVNAGLRIEEIIDRTWKPKEQVPEVAKPRWGGPVGYWINALNGCQVLLEDLLRELEGQDLEAIIYPHVLSGPLNVVQRLEFLRFHLNRHQQQIERIKARADFPG